MRSLDQLKSDIADRYTRIADANADTVDEEVAIVRDWIRKRPELLLALAQAEQSEPGLDFEKWRPIAASYDFTWTATTEGGRTWLIWQLVTWIADRVRQGQNNVVVGFSGRFQKQGVRDLNELTRRVADQLLRPMFEYLIEHAEVVNMRLLAMLRYVARIEWFDRASVFAGYEAAVAHNHGGEDFLNLDLRRFLFLDAGIVTYAEAKTATGRPDLIAALGTDDPLVCEGKVFAGGGRDKGYLAKGVRQVIENAKDCAATTAHLVIYNITDRNLHLPSDAAAATLPPYLDESGVRVYLYEVRLKPPATTASKLGKADVIVVTREDLVTVTAP